MYNTHLKELDISVLVNNVGVADIEEFQRADEQKVHDLITVNVYSTALMTH